LPRPVGLFLITCLGVGDLLLFSAVAYCHRFGPLQASGKLFPVLEIDDTGSDWEIRPTATVGGGGLVLHVTAAMQV
jgi:hypothetical protein